MKTSTLDAGYDTKWANNLRINLDYHQELYHKLDEGIIERQKAAKALLLERDCKSQLLLNNLRKGEEIHQEYLKKSITR